MQGLCVEVLNNFIGSSKIDCFARVMQKYLWRIIRMYQQIHFVMHNYNIRMCYILDGDDHIFLH